MRFDNTLKLPLLQAISQSPYIPKLAWLLCCGLVLAACQPNSEKNDPQVYHYSGETTAALTPSASSTSVDTEASGEALESLAGTLAQRATPPQFIPKLERSTAFQTPAGIAYADESFNIIYQTPSGWDTAQVRVDLSYSDDRLGNLNALPIAQNIPLQSTGFSYVWDTRTIPEGLYSIHATIRQGEQSRIVVSSGAVSILHGAVTHQGYYGDIEKIFQENCQICHRLEGGGSPSFYDYNTTVQAVARIKAVIRKGGRGEHLGYMPPFFVADDGSRFSAYRGLSERQIRKIEQWIADGTPAGASEASLPYAVPATTQPSGRALELQMPQAFQPSQYQKKGEDIYQCFLFDPQFTKTTFVMGADVRPQNKKIVHHVIIYALAPKLAETARKQEASNPDQGYRCYGGPLPAGSLSSLTDWQNVGGWAPGDSPKDSKGSGFMLAPGTLLAVQVHYFTGYDPQGSDQSTFKLWVSEDPPKAVQLTIPVPDLSLNIPAGAKDHEEMVAYKVNSNFNVWINALYPHAHMLGKQVSFSITRVSGETEVLLHVPRWNFNWQGSYALEKPVAFNKGDQLNVRCTYDNSSENPYQPHQPPIKVHWGDATTDEMCLVYMMVTLGQAGNATSRTSENAVPTDRESVIKNIFGEEIGAQISALPVKSHQMAEAQATCGPGRQGSN